mmetsp:Transcript_3888/g.11012  ORF Transcript_3888/g.11012 Transcript_3888/m.11012 type:complete len:203 (-) Transcript_3888:1223-1831(-)
MAALLTCRTSCTQCGWSSTPTVPTTSACASRSSLPLPPCSPWCLSCGSCSPSGAEPARLPATSKASGTGSTSLPSASCGAPCACGGSLCSARLPPLTSPFATMSMPASPAPPRCSSWAARATLAARASWRCRMHLVSYRVLWTPWPGTMPSTASTFSSSLPASSSSWTSSPAWAWSPAPWPWLAPTLPISCSSVAWCLLATP